MGKTIIIAEIGECFNGDLEVAKKLMFAAKNAGCDIAKFQTLDYENIQENDPESDWFKKIALTVEKINLLIKYADETGIDILFSPENLKTAKWLIRSGLKDVKIASNTMQDKELIKFINCHFEHVFMSTGMALLEEVKDAVDSLNKVSELYIMHCVSEYPTGPLLEKRGLKALSHDDVRLNMMKMLMEEFPRYKIGYSDHTQGILAPLAAVAMGAKVIEKHITLDRKTPIENFLKGKEYLGTDHILSIEPDELKEMVRRIREMERMFGTNKWERSEGEYMLRNFLRGRFASK
ncbi:MAG: N-acetylneuraminate synthase family protein [Candidatus Omnitrophota bacterium]|nr:MAG: N-acetylneuraminate synthase family protein [Candidatus Omnitrophota bacterium]